MKNAGIILVPIIVPVGGEPAPPAAYLLGMVISAVLFFSFDRDMRFRWPRLGFAVFAVVMGTITLGSIVLVFGHPVPVR